MWILIKYLLYNLHVINVKWLNELWWLLCFLLQIVVEEFLEDVNNILNSGEVPNLFEKDELEQVLAATRPKAKEAGISEGNRDEVECVKMVIWLCKTKTCFSLFKNGLPIPLRSLWIEFLFSVQLVSFVPLCTLFPAFKALVHQTPSKVHGKQKTETLWPPWRT